MSDTLQEQEDQIASEEADERTFQRIRRARLIGNPNQNADWCDDCHGYTHMPWCPSYKEPDTRRSGEMGHRTNHEQPASTHQPAARGGGERVKVELINGVEGQCVVVNDYRICGPKPWGGGSVAQSWTTDKNDVLRAFLTPDQKHAWLADELEVVSINQHQSLVAERDRLRDALRIIRDIGWTTYMGTVKNIAQRALATDDEQRSTSE